LKPIIHHFKSLMAGVLAVVFWTAVIVPLNFLFRAYGDVILNIAAGCVALFALWLLGFALLTVRQDIATTKSDPP
jgi:hypothetical protein